MTSGYPQTHPSPHRGRTRLVLLLLSLAAGPAGWIAQLVVGYGLANYACYPDSRPQLHAPPPGWAGENLWLVALNLACLVVCAAGFLLAAAAWRRTRDEKPGNAQHLLETGEGRTRFLAVCGMLATAVFAAAILVNTVTILGVPSCWEFAP